MELDSLLRAGAGAVVEKLVNFRNHLFHDTIEFEWVAPQPEHLGQTCTLASVMLSLFRLHAALGSTANVCSAHGSVVCTLPKFSSIVHVISGKQLLRKVSHGLCARKLIALQVTEACSRRCLCV